MKSFLEGIINLCLAIADILGYKLKVTLSKHKIKFGLVSKDEIDKMAYDKDHYVNGNVFLQGFSNPIKPILDDAEENVDLISSARYKDYMKNKLVSQMIKTAEGGKWSTKAMLKVIIAITGGILAIIVGFAVLMFM